MSTLHRVPTAKVAAAVKRWPSVATELERGASRSHGMMTMASIAEGLRRDHLQLWVVLGDDDELIGTGLTQLGFEPSGIKVCTIYLTVGAGMKDETGHLAEIEAWAEREGCQRVQLWGRKGWARQLTTYRMTHVILQKDIALWADQATSK
jgi:hypothetical protein